MSEHGAILGSLSPQQFLQQYWQAQPLLVRSATHAWGEVLSPQELAGLAMEASVESRIVRGHASDAHAPWALRHGPFEAHDFTDAPAEGWTLMVQSVDQWLPEVAAIMAQFSFLPSWRVDDVMVSYAAPGGGVGPHFDYYDVFLLQTRGRRRWQLGQRCDHTTPLQPDQPLRLLAAFAPSAEHDLAPGDMLYVPAGLAHWGTSLSEDCMTWSIGFRAPSAASLISRAVEHLAPMLSQSLRYRDGDGTLNAPPGQMNAAVEAQLESLLGALPRAQWREAMSQALGELMTEARYEELSEPVEDQEAAELWHQYVAGQRPLSTSRHSRFAYRAREELQAELFVDGEGYQVSVSTAQWLCEGKLDRPHLAGEGDRQVLIALIASGALVSA